MNYDELCSNVSQLLTMYCGLKRISKAELSRKTGLSIRTVLRFMDGSGTIVKPSVLNSFLAVMGLEVKFYFDNTEVKNYD